MKVTIPRIVEHAGFVGNLITVEISDNCPVCGGPRGELYQTHSYDGSRRLSCDGWKNPCGHVDRYADVILEAQQAKPQEIADMKIQTLMGEIERLDSEIDAGFYDGDPVGLDRAIHWKVKCINRVAELWPLALTIPRSMTVEDAKYWLDRARQLCPGREIVPKFV